MVMPNDSSFAQAMKLIADWLATKDSWLALEEHLQLMHAQEESTEDPAGRNQAELEAPSSIDLTPIELPLIDETDTEELENGDEQVLWTGASSFPEVDCSALDQAGARPNTTPAELHGPPAPAELRTTGEHQQWTRPPNPREAGDRENRARAYQLGTSPCEIDESAQQSDAQPSGPPSALELLESSAICEHCGHSGVHLDIPRPPYRYVCAGCLHAARSAVPEFLRQVRNRGSQKIRERAGVTGEVLFYDPAELAHLVEATHMSSEPNENTLNFLARLVASGHRRSLYAPVSNWSKQLEALEDAHPNFAQVIREVLRPTLAIRAAGGRARPVPVLLLGEPGVGKTHFARALANFMQVPWMLVDLASAQSGSMLSGSSAFWANSAPGELSSLLAFGSGGHAAHADPIVFLDEIDKVGQDLRYDPIGALYQLLEVESARQFTDLALPGLRFDASYVCWILAANSLQGIPAPILSRIRTIEIRPPGALQQRDLLRRIFSQLVRDTGIASFSQELPAQVIEHCISWGLREFKNVANVAIGHALAEGRWAVAPPDFESSVSAVVGRQRHRMGFI